MARVWSEKNGFSPSHHSGAGERCWSSVCVTKVLHCVQGQHGKLCLFPPSFLSISLVSLVHSRLILFSHRVSHFCFFSLSLAFIQPGFPGLWFQDENGPFCTRAKSIRDAIHGDVGDERWCRDSVRLGLDSWAEIQQRAIFITIGQLFELIGAVAMILEVFVTLRDSAVCCCKKKDSTKVSPEQKIMTK